MKLWGGRFDEEMDPDAWKLNASINFDHRLGEQDIRGSQAWAAALEEAGVLNEDEYRLIQEGLNTILQEYRAGSFHFHPADEDIHTAVERRLGEVIGPAAGKLHTGRSRNDQVATDFRLWLMDHIPLLDRKIHTLQQAFVERAEQDMQILMPGYTHLQRAQPVLLSHWWLSYFWKLVRDRKRLAQVLIRTSVMPLGSGALAGTPYKIDRHKLAESLGFKTPSPNSIDAVSDRDFAADFLFASALLGVHLSQLSEQVILFTSAEFGFFTLGDAYSSGSSLMPQKKNPDVFEVVRGSAGRLSGSLVEILTLLKGLPSIYDKDLQGDKIPVFESYDLLSTALPVITKAIRTLTVNKEKLSESLDDNLLATDIADYLVLRGVPFREAHGVVGNLVRYAMIQEKELSTLELEEYKQYSDVFEEDVFDVMDSTYSVNQRKVYGGTSEESVARQIKEAEAYLEETTV